MPEWEEPAGAAALLLEQEPLMRHRKARNSEERQAVGGLLYVGCVRQLVD